ncbi:MAG: FHA domain-containing protein [Actinomycetota bacterium]|nr:FHA domain-containing protein [Actinomycetota bacterium]
MSEPLLAVLKWCLLALLYLFFFRVLQVTWHFSGAASGTASADVKRTETRSVGPGRAKAPAAGGKQFAGDVQSVWSLRVLEPPSLAGRAFEVKGSATLGRAAGCEITLDDTFVSQMHARVSLTDVGVVLEDLGSTNGTYLNRQRVTSATVVQPGDQIQLGGIVLELRS